MKNHIRIVPHLDALEPSLVFHAIERDLEEGFMLRLGRFSDRTIQYDRITFKSKVVSRGHAAIGFHDNKVRHTLHCLYDF